MEKKLKSGIIIMVMISLCAVLAHAAHVLAAGMDGVKWMENGRSLIGILTGEHSFQVMGSGKKIDFCYRVLAQDTPSYPVWAGFLARDTELPAQGGLNIKFRKRTFVTFNDDNGLVIGGCLAAPATFSIRIPETDLQKPRRWKLVPVKFTPGDNSQPITFSSADDGVTKAKVTVVDCGTLAEDIELPNEKGIPFSWTAGTPVYVKGYGVARGQKSILMTRHFKFFEEADNALR